MMVSKEDGSNSSYVPAESNEDARRAWIEPEVSELDMRLAELGGTL
jgi:hypothetical protein